VCVTLARAENIEEEDALQVGNAERGERDLLVAQPNADEWATQGCITVSRTGTRDDSDTYDSAAH